MDEMSKMNYFELKYIYGDGPTRSFWKIDRRERLVHCPNLNNGMKSFVDLTNRRDHSRETRKKRASVPTDGVEDLPFALSLDSGEYVTDVIVQIVRLRERLRNFQNDEGPDRRLLVVILNVEVDDVNELFGVGTSRLQALDALVVNPFLGGENEVEAVFGVLKPFGPWLNPSVAIQHVKNSILRVESFVFLG